MRSVDYTAVDVTPGLSGFAYLVVLHNIYIFIIAH